MTEVWFIRHGESLSNAGHVVERTETVPLTEKGQAQAVAVSQVFTNAPDLVVVTPYLRTQLTAIPTLERFPTARREIWPLQEFSCLSHVNYRNTNMEQRRPFVKAYWDRYDPDHVDGEGAESFNAMVGRIQAALQKLQAAPEEFIAVFAHGRIMHTLRFLLERPAFSVKEIMQVIPDYVLRAEIENCEIIRLTADKHRVRMHPEDKEVFEKGFQQTEKEKSYAQGV